MADTPGWKRTLQEPNALGWIALFAVVAAVGIGAIIFGRGSDKAHNPKAAIQTAPANQAK